MYALDVYFIVASLAVLLLVIGLLIYIVLKFRAQPGDEEPRQIGGNRKLEILMIGGPTVLVAIFFYLTVTTMRAVHPPAGNRSPDVVINGRQFWWEASYPGTAVTTANEIHLPVGRTLLLQLRAADVIHDWWVPTLGQKMDAIPGQSNHLWVTIKKPGIYDGVCSEFCGAQHAWMRIRVVAQPEAEYRRWLQERGQSARTPAGGTALTGAHIFKNATCGNCHRVRGTDASGNAGPDLTHFASRKTMLAGMLPNTKENVRKWLQNPQAVKPGALMPQFKYPKDSLNALVDYLVSLQ